MQNVVRPIRLFIVDPQPLIAAALGHFFEASSAFNVTGAAQHVRPSTLRTIRPDVVVLAREHGAANVCDSIAAAKDAVPSAKVFVLSCHTHPELLSRAMASGASGYAVKDISPTAFVNAVQTVAQGFRYVDARVEESIGRANGSTRRNNSLNSLSERETEIVRLIAEGHSNRQISATLGLSEKTIKNHISRIFAKLHITARTQAVMHAIKTGIA